MRLLVGLGNPGRKYQNIKHNVGFNAIKTIADKYKISNFQNKFDGQIAKTKIIDEQILLFMPMTYMNNSGIPLNKIINFYKIPIRYVYVIYDDLDLEIGKIKIKRNGGNAGHNGLKSIDNHIGKSYNKIKIGIGRPLTNTRVINYVLSGFTKFESERIKIPLNFITENLSILLKDDAERFINLYYNNI